MQRTRKGAKEEGWQTRVNQRRKRKRTMNWRWKVAAKQRKLKEDPRLRKGETVVC